MGLDDGSLVQGLDAPTAPLNPADGKYVYCIIAADSPQRFGRIGIGGRGDEVYTIHYRGLAAVVSDTPVQPYDPTRENALTHEHVNDTVMKEFTVIPMSFGTVFVSEQNVVEFLKDTADALHDVLVKMRDKIEFGLKVNWDTETVLAKVEEEREDIRQLKEEILSNRLASTYFARMQLGRLVEQAMNEKSEAYVREIYNHLRDCAIASRHNKPIGDKMILNAAFLIERDKAEIFDQKVQEIARRSEGTLRFLYTGPWPPYNFVNIRLKLERSRGCGLMLLRLLTAPVGGPIAGFRFLLEQIRDMAEQELFSEDRIREELLLLQLRLEEGEIGEDEYASLESEIIARLRQARARRQALPDQFTDGDPRSEVEAIVDQQ